MGFLVPFIIFNLFLEPWVERGMIYFPAKEIDQTPKSIGLAYEDVYIKSSGDKKIHGWFVENKDSSNVVLFFHGNGSNISDRIPIIKILYQLPASIFMIDYQGYGKSEGMPSEQNLYSDAKASYDYLITQKKYLSSQIVVMGRSLGGAVAVDLASRKDVKGVILESTFSSGEDMAKYMCFLFRKPIVWIRSKFDSPTKITLIKSPILIIHSKEDLTIPYQMSQDLYEKANEPKKLLLLQRGNHDYIKDSKEYIDSLKQIVK